MPIPVVVAFLWLSVLYGWQTRGHVTPWLFTDELKYTQIARSIAETGRASERHHSVAFDTLYTYAIAPFWRIHDVHTAYSAIKYFGVIVMTAAIFPTYLLARMVVSRFWALFAAIGAVAGPSLAYGSFVIEEPLAYPAAALSFLLIAKGLVTRSWRWNIAASISVLLATLIRGQLAVLIVAYVLAALFLAWTSDPMTRWRAGWSAWDWVGFVVLTIGGIIVFSASVGAFSQTWLVATGYYRHRMIVYGLWAGGAFSIGVGLLPVISLAALVRPKGVPWTRELRAFVALTSASVVVFGLYTAVKAAYLSTVFSTVVEERNLIYLAPLLFVATGLAFQRRRLNLVALAASAGFVLYVILTTPFQLDLFPYADALGLAIVQMANRDLAFDDGDVKVLLSVVLVISIALLLLPGLRAVATAALARDRDHRRRRRAGDRVEHGRRGLGVERHQQLLEEPASELPHPADLDRRRNRREADDLPRAEDHRPTGNLADGVLEPRAERTSGASTAPRRRRAGRHPATSRPTPGRTAY